MLGIVASNSRRRQVKSTWKRLSRRPKDYRIQPDLPNALWVITPSHHFQISWETVLYHS